MRGLIPSNMLLKLPTKEFTEPQLISYSPGRVLLRDTFLPCPYKPPRFTLCSANNHIYIVIYSLLLSTSPQLSPEESSSVTQASSTPTKQSEASPGRLAGTSPIAGIEQRNEGWEEWGANLRDHFLFQRKESVVACSPGRPDTPSSRNP